MKKNIFFRIFLLAFPVLMTGNVSAQFVGGIGRGDVAGSSPVLNIGCLPPTPSVSVSENSGFVSGDGIICAGGSVSLTASGGATYLWSTGSTATNITVAPPATTTYSVTLTNPGGCTALETVVITVNPLPVPAVTFTENSGNATNDGIICNGDAITLAVSGGDQYSWTDGFTTSELVVSPLSTSSYSVTVTNNGGCSATAAPTVTVNPLPTATVTISESSGTPNDGVLCQGASALLAASGGASYLWNNGTQTSVAAVMPQTGTTYTVTVTGTGGCTATAESTLTISTPPSPSIAVSESSGQSGNDGIICEGYSATLSATGGNTYLWNTSFYSSAQITVTPVIATLYEVTATDANGCTETASVTVYVNPLPTLVVNSVDVSGVFDNDGIVCAGDSVTLYAEGGNSYTWNNGNNSSSVLVSPFSSTIYTVTVSDASGCTASASTLITVNQLPQAALTVYESSGDTPDDNIICSGDEAQITAFGGSTFVWNTGDYTSQIYVSPDSSATYSVTVNDNNGCFSTANVSVSVNNLPQVALAVNGGSVDQNGFVCRGASVSLAASGAANYLWNTGETSTTIEVSPDSTSAYSVIATSDAGCSTSVAATITVNDTPVPGLSVTETSGNGINDGTVCSGDGITLTASGGNQYAWNTGYENTASLSLSPLVTTVYTVTVTSAAGCSSSTSTIVTVSALPAPITILSGLSGSTDSICRGNEVIIGLTEPFVSYAWNTVPGQSSQSVTVSPLFSREYTVTVTDYNSCSSVTSTLITVLELPTPAISVSESSGTTSDDGVVCNGSSIMLTATGGESYVWSSELYANPSGLVAPLTTTTYTVTVTSQVGCTSTASTTVTVNPQPQPVLTVTDLSGAANISAAVCSGSSAVLNVSNIYGTGSYVWNTTPIQTTQSITVSPSSNTTYTVTVTDDNLCSSIDSVTVTVISLPTPSVFVAETSGNIYNDGVICDGASVTMTASGGTSYSWSTGETAAAIPGSPVATSTYTVTVTNANGCSSTASKTITVNSLPAPNVFVTETSGNTYNDGYICAGESALLTASSGTSYTWSTGEQTADISGSPTATTSYTVTVTDANGCFSTTSATITVNLLPFPTITVAETSGDTSNDGVICIDASATLYASGGTAYSWNTIPTQATAAIIVTPIVNSTYTVTVSNSDGCTETTSATITVYQLPVPSITVAETSGSTNNDGTICNGSSAAMTASGGMSYAWNTGDTVASITSSPIVTTTYTVTVTNQVGCSSSAYTQITVNDVDAPVVICPTGTTVNTDSGSSCSITIPDYVAAIIPSDNCTSTSSIVESQDIPPGAYSVSGDGAILTVNYTASDGTNSTTCTITITVDDNDAPVVTCPPNTTVNMNSGLSCSITIPDYVAAINPSDNCTSTSSIVESQDILPGPYNVSGDGSTVTVTYTATDDATPANTAVCKVVITVRDDDQPEVICPPNLTLGTITGTSCQIIIPDFAAALAPLDNCTSSIDLNESQDIPPGPYTVTSSGAIITVVYTVSDDAIPANSAQCVVTIEVEPSPSPSVTVSEMSGNASDDEIICAGSNVTLISSDASAYLWSNGETSGTIVSSPTVTTTYSVTLTTASGCTTAASTTITVNPLPTPTITITESSGPAGPAVCKADPVALSVDQTYPDYVWNTTIPNYNQSVTVYPDADVAYVVTVTDGNNCQNTASSTEIVVLERPDNTLFVQENSGTPDDGIVCGSNGVVISTADGVSFAWNNGSVTAGISEILSVNTNYSVTITDIVGCTSVGTASVLVNTPVSVSLLVTESSGATNNDGQICLGSSAVITASASGGSIYVWSNGDNSGNLTVSPVATETYSVTASDNAGCSASASIQIAVSDAPEVASISPLSGTTGTVVTLSGLHFSDATMVQLNGVNCPFSIESPTVISVVMPFSGTIQSAVVTNSCGSSGCLGNPDIVSIAPSSGPAGTLVTITGTDLDCIESFSINGVPQILLSSSAVSATIFVMPGTQSGPITGLTLQGSLSSSSSFEVTPTPFPTLQQGVKMTGTGAAGTGRQAGSIAMSADGNTAVVGAPNDNFYTGAAWVFVRNGAIWSQQGAKLVGTGALGNARQGTSVAMDARGNHIVVGGATDNLNAGAAWIFSRIGDNWSQQGAKLVGTGAAGAAQQGTSVSMSADGKTVAVGGIADNDYAGAAWVFSLTGNNWVQQGSKLVGSGAVGTSRQGCSVALSSDGNTLAVGGYYDNFRKGATWVYSRSGGSFLQQVHLIGAGGSSDANQGWSVALSADGNQLLTGGPGDAAQKGAAWAFTRSAGIWSQQGGKFSGAGSVGTSRQGSAVALSADGKTALLGGPGDNGGRGAFWVFTNNGNFWWSQQGTKLAGANASGLAQQGAGIALSSTGATAAAGGPADALDKGAVWFFHTGNSFVPDPTTDRSVQSQQPELMLGQNIPNPHTGQTTVVLNLPRASDAIWQVCDVNGKIILEWQREYPAGENVETFDLSGYSGVYWYTIKTPFGARTRKMVVVPR